MSDDFDWDSLTGPKREGAGVGYDEVLEPIPAEVIAKYNSIPGLATAIMAKSNGTMSARTIDGVVYRVRTSANVAAKWQSTRGSKVEAPAEKNDLMTSPWDD